MTRPDQIIQRFADVVSTRAFYNKPTGPVRMCWVDVQVLRQLPRSPISDTSVFEFLAHVFPDSPVEVGPTWDFVLCDWEAGGDPCRHCGHGT